ncbi:MAG TPA: PKD domain-containing protein [Candidatus Vogelbacteria bacterium]|nr:PKD domain-containing protein [Candidatus Vogelbacteria bacterium]
MKGLKLLFLILFLLIPFNFVWGGDCQVSQIAILKGSWSSDEHNLSLTVQSQDSSGEECKVSSEAISPLRISFETSGSGIFTRQADNEPPIGRINRGVSANHHFYYRNYSSEDVITLKAGYGDADNWIPEFEISAQISDFLIDEPEDQEDEDVVVLPISAGGSAHSSPAPLVTTSPSKPQLEVSAGRHRLGVVGAPLVFKAEKITEKDLSSRIYYDWTMGDGFAKSGEVIEHSYEFPGIYEVVLNSSADSVRSVSRIKVEIVPALVEVVDFNKNENYLVLKNEGNKEINLGGWKLLSKQTEYIFPVDTIISARNELKLSLSIFDGRELGNNIILNLPSGKKASDYLSTKQAIIQEEVIVQETTNQNLALQEAERNYNLLQSRVWELERKLAQVSSEPKVEPVKEKLTEEETIQTESTEEVIQKSTSASSPIKEPELALVLNTEKPFWRKMFRRAIFWR